MLSLPNPVAPLPAKIIGHDKQLGQLLGDIAKANVAHAYLFSGPKHLGKFTIARWFASLLLCEGVPPEQHPRVRDQIERMIHPDFLVLDRLWVQDRCEDWAEIGKTSNVSQQHRTKAPAARTNTIGIDDVLSLSNRLQETSSSRYFCCLIRSVERMQPTAAGPFLKILEEPPSRVIFILTTESQSALLPTVISRTRLLKFHPLPSPSLRPLLSGIAPDDAQLLLHLAEGAPGKVTTLMKDPELLRAEKQLHSQAKYFWQATSLAERFQWITSFADKAEQTGALLTHLGLALRERADDGQKARWTEAYVDLATGLKTNAHRWLLLERFALAVSAERANL